MFEGRYICSFASIHVHWKLGGCLGFPSVLAPQRMSICRDGEEALVWCWPGVLSTCVKVFMDAHTCTHPSHRRTDKDLQGAHHSGMVSIFSPWRKIRLNFKSKLDLKNTFRKVPPWKLPYRLLNRARVLSCFGAITICSIAHQTNEEGGLCLEALCCLKKKKKGMHLNH